MKFNPVTHKMRAALVLLTVAGAYGQTRSEPTDVRVLIREGDTALAQNRPREAAAAFQKAVDLNPSSAKAHEGLGAALFRAIVAGNIRPSNDADIAQRAENHLKQAYDLSPSTPEPLIQLSQLEAALAERAADGNERAERYRKAQDALKRVIDLKPSDAGLYFQLANLERDEFGPVIQQAKGRSAKTAGPLSDPEFRRALQSQYAELINDAIANAKRASELNGRSARPLLLLSKLLQDRAVIRDTTEQYTADMQSAEQWRLQFLSVGGHSGEGETAADQ
jgi:tetratricopeptide (TPR) repeat protein